MFHCSAAEGQKFQEEVTRISEIIENLGSSPLKEPYSSDQNENDQKDEKHTKNPKE